MGQENTVNLEELNLDDIKNFVKSGTQSLHFQAKLSKEDRFKLNKVKDKLNIKNDSDFLKAVIDLYFMYYFEKKAI